MKKHAAIHLVTGSILASFSVSFSAQAQTVPVPDNTLPENSVVTSQGEMIQIKGGTTRGSNLFHSFQEFSVSADSEVVFNNADSISNILSRVTGDSISNIDGLIRANGMANLFLINPAGIVFGEGASLNVGGSFIATTADSVLFSDGFEYSATNPQAPLLTINVPIGLSFRGDPGAIINRSTANNSNGLSVPADKTLALIGGDVSLEERGSMTTLGGRIEIGSVAGDSTVSLTEVEKGWDIGYEGVESFQDITLSGEAFVSSQGEDTGDIQVQGRDITLSGEAFVYSYGEDTGDIQVQGRNITLTEFSTILIENEGGQAANLEIVGSDSIELEQTTLDEINNFKTSIVNDALYDATGEGSQLIVETNRLKIKGGQILTFASGSGRGIDLDIKASEIELTTNNGVNALIAAQVFDRASGDGGNLTVETGKLTLDQGAQISTLTVGSGDAGDLLVNAKESIELIGTIPGSNDASALSAGVAKEAIATGDGGDLTVNTSRLVLRDGAQIETVAHNEGDAGDVTINASESVLLNGFSPDAELGGEGRSGIFVSAEPSFEDESGRSIPTTGNGGTLNLTTEKLIIEQGALISADTFSLGDGGNANINVNRLIVRNGGQIGAGSLIGVDPIDRKRGAGGSVNINATESVEVSGSGEINGEPVVSLLFTRAESTGNAGNLRIDAQQLTLDDGSITAETASSQGGNITLNVGDTLQFINDGEITATAGTAQAGGDGGNVTLNADFILAFPTDETYEITAEAFEGDGGNINLTTNTFFGSQYVDISASSQLGLEGNVSIELLELNPTRGLTELPTDVIDASQLIARTCLASGDTAEAQNKFVVTGRGGLPANPNESLSGEAVLSAEWVTLPPERPGETGEQQSFPSHPSQPQKIVEMRGWTVDASGTIILTANPASSTVKTPRLDDPACN